MKIFYNKIIKFISKGALNMKYPMSLEEHDIKEFKESVVLNLSDGQTLKALPSLAEHMFSPI